MVISIYINGGGVQKCKQENDIAECSKLYSYGKENNPGSTYIYIVPIHMPFRATTFGDTKCQQVFQVFATLTD